LAIYDKKNLINELNSLGNQFSLFIVLRP